MLLRNGTYRNCVTLCSVPVLTGRTRHISPLSRFLHHSHLPAPLCLLLPCPSHMTEPYRTVPNPRIKPSIASMHAHTTTAPTAGTQDGPASPKKRMSVNKLTGQGTVQHAPHSAPPCCFCLPLAFTPPGHPQASVTAPRRPQSVCSPSAACTSQPTAPAVHPQCGILDRLPARPPILCRNRVSPWCVNDARVSCKPPCVR